MDCPLCTKQYQSENDLKRHLKRIHKIDDADSLVREITIGDLCNWKEENYKLKFKGL